MYRGCHVTTIIPALDEAVSIASVLQQLNSLTADDIPVIDRIVVCDNGSSDGTADIAATLGAEVVHEPCRGYGAACLKALSVVSDTDILLFVNADGSEKISETVILLDRITKEAADLVIGSRVAELRENRALSPQQLFGNWLAAFLIRTIWRQPVTDLGPFRAIRFDRFRALNMRDRNYGWTVEMQLKAIRQNRNIVEVPVSALRGSTPSRVSGTLAGTLGAACKILGTIFLYGMLDGIPLITRHRDSKAASGMAVHEEQHRPGRP